MGDQTDSQVLDAKWKKKQLHCRAARCPNKENNAESDMRWMAKRWKPAISQVRARCGQTESQVVAGLQLAFTWDSG